jgi:hypothetical protein
MMRKVFQVPMSRDFLIVRASTDFSPLIPLRHSSTKSFESTPARFSTTHRTPVINACEGHRSTVAEIQASKRRKAAGEQLHLSSNCLNPELAKLKPEEVPPRFRFINRDVHRTAFCSDRCDKRKVQIEGARTIPSMKFNFDVTNKPSLMCT